MTLPLPFVVIPAELPGWPTVSFGLARTGSLGAGLGPLFSSSIAILVLGEDPNWRILTGALLIVVGISALALEKGSWGSTECVG